MSADLDGAPIYDPMVQPVSWMISDSWQLWINTFIQTLQEYVSSFGIFVPQLTSDQIAQILSPIEGQMVYNLTMLAPQIWQNGAWKTFTTV